MNQELFKMDPKDSENSENIHSGPGVKVKMDLEQHELYRTLKEEDVERVKKITSTEKLAIENYFNSENETFLHVAVRLRCSPEIVGAIIPYVNIAHRNIKGKTAYDLATDHQDVEFSNAFKSMLLEYISELMRTFRIERLKDIMREGWNIWPCYSQQIQELFEEAPELEEYVKKSKPLKWCEVEKMKELNLLVSKYEPDAFGEFFLACMKLPSTENPTLDDAEEFLADNEDEEVIAFKTKLEKIDGQSEHDSELTKEFQNLARKLQKKEKEDTLKTVDCFGLTVLHKGCLQSHYAFVKECVTYLTPETVNIQDIRGRTALHFAAFQQDILMYDLLTKNGADENIQDKDGHSPMGYFNCSNMCPCSLESSLATLSDLTSHYQDYQKAYFHPNTNGLHELPKQDNMFGMSMLLSIYLLRGNDGRDYSDANTLHDYKGTDLFKRNFTHYFAIQSIANWKDVADWKEFCKENLEKILKFSKNIVDPKAKDIDGHDYQYYLNLNKESAKSIADNVRKLIHVVGKSSKEQYLCLTFKADIEEFLKEWAGGVGGWPEEIVSVGPVQDNPYVIKDNISGLPLAHIAVILLSRGYKNGESVTDESRDQGIRDSIQEYLINCKKDCDENKKFPVDYMGRNILHYVAGLYEKFPMLWTTLEACEELKHPDFFGHTPEYFKENPKSLNLDELIEKIIQPVQMIEATRIDSNLQTPRVRLTGNSTLWAGERVEYGISDGNEPRDPEIEIKEKTEEDKQNVHKETSANKSNETDQMVQRHSTEVLENRQSTIDTAEMTDSSETDSEKDEDLVKSAKDVSIKIVPKAVPKRLDKPDPYAVKNTQPPSTQESDYIAKTVGPALVKGVAEVMLKMPRDPIEFLAQYLYKHAENVEHFYTQEEMKEKLAVEIKVDDADRKRKEILKKEIADMKSMPEKARTEHNGTIQEED